MRSKKRQLPWKFLFIVLGLTYAIGCFHVIEVGTQETRLARRVFKTTPPDLLAIFTGDGGRIQLGINTSRDFHGGHIFITGVYGSNSLETVLEKQGIGPVPELSPYIEIDYHAKNTVENVISTLHYLEEQNIRGRILIVSSDYHIMRVKMIVDSLAKNYRGTSFYFMGVETPLTTSSLKKIAKEIVKTLKAAAVLLFWDH